jgi:hypothetical protein
MYIILPVDPKLEMQVPIELRVDIAYYYFSF